MHMIDFSNNRANMAFVGDRRAIWHGLGQQISEEDHGNLDVWRVNAGFDFEFETRPVEFRPHPLGLHGEYHQFKNRNVIYRNDTLAPIHVATDQYKIVQPAEILGFFEDILAGGRWAMTTAGMLKGGAVYWACAKSQYEIDFGGGDRVHPYLMLFTSVDGSMATGAKESMIRPVCWNTLSSAVGSRGQKADVRVSHRSQFDAQAVKKELGIFDNSMEEWASDVDQLIDTEVSVKQAIEFFVELYAPKRVKAEGEDLTKRETTNLEKTVNRLLELYTHGDGAMLPTARGTAWGLVNAVTNFVDHDTRARSNENRFSSGQFGAGAKKKAEAFDFALEIAA